MFRFVLIVGSILVTLDLLWWWRGDAWARTLDSRRAWRIGWGVFMLVQTIGILLLLFARYVGLDRTAGLPTWLLTFLFVWHLLVLPGVWICFIIGGTGWSIARLVGMLLPRRASDTHETPDLLAAPTRRQFLASAAVAIPPLLTLGGSAWAIPQVTNFRIRRFTIDLPTLPRDLDGLTIAQVADVHIGDFTNGKTLADIVEATNQLKAHLVLMPGDLLNRRLSDLSAATDMCRRIDPKHGILLCEGNNDLFEGRAAFAAGVRDAGLPLLVGQSDVVTIRGCPVQILGLPWGARRFEGDDALNASVDQLLAQRRPDAFPILLAHHPHAFDRAADAGIPLTLAGHTHGGQLMLTRNLGFGPAMFRYWSGLYERGPSKLVVSNGVGNWFPLRINAPAEIVHITLRRDA
jgi:predicted MPP superfamily phosphohydrolase